MKSTCVNSINRIRSQAKSYEYKIKYLNPLMLNVTWKLSVKSWFYFSLVLSTESPKNNNSPPTINTPSTQIQFLNTILHQMQSKGFGEKDDSTSGSRKCKISLRRFCARKRASTQRLEEACSQDIKGGSKGPTGQVLDNLRIKTTSVIDYKTLTK